MNRAPECVIAIVAMAAATLALTLPAVGGAALAAWDQEKVTELSGQLLGATKSLLDVERKQPPPSPDPNQRVRAQYLQTLRAFERSARQLQRRLQAGADREATLPIAKKMRTLVRDAETHGRRFLDTAQVTEAAKPVYAALDALAPFYFEDDGGSQSP
jgi:hypothetical protein